MKIWGGAKINSMVAAAVLLCIGGIPLCGQPGGARVAGKTGAQALIASATGSAAKETVLREIEDPNSGVRWLLVPDSAHPGGPGHLIAAKPRPAGAQEADPVMPVIHTGDRVVVEQHSEVMDARLEAVAMGPARIGSPFQVRLRVGGKVLRAVALAPGRAALALELEARQ
jgi:hypothetical protein